MYAIRKGESLYGSARVLRGATYRLTPMGIGLQRTFIEILLP